MCLNKLFQKDLSNRNRYYFIHKNQHRSKRTPGQPRWVSIPNQLIHYEFIIGNSWFYPKEFDVGWNKLPGLTSFTPLYSLFKWEKPIHLNSARLGWRCTNNKIRFASYCYVDGERIIEEVPQSYKEGDIINIYIHQIQDITYFKINETSSITQKGFTRSLNWLTHFYFGGLRSAPHHIETIIKFI